MKKGFTLIELLAVIVILAIIALIATPIVLGIINDTKESSVLRSADFYLDGVELSIAQSVLKNIHILDGTYKTMQDGNVCIGTFNSNTCIGEILEVEVDGEVPKEGSKITIIDGQIESVKLKYNEKEIVKDIKNNLIYLENKYEVGEEVTFNPGDGDKTWNVIDEDATTVTLILSENLGNTVAWYTASEDNSYGPKDALEYLNSLTIEWDNVDPIKNYTYMNNYDGTSKPYGYQKIVIKNGTAKLTHKDGITITEVNGKSKARLLTLDEVFEIAQKTNINLTEENLTDFIINNLDAVNEKLGTNLTTVDEAIVDVFEYEGESHMLGESKYMQVYYTVYWMISDFVETTYDILLPEYLYQNLYFDKAPYRYWTLSSYPAGSHSAWDVYYLGYVYGDGVSYGSRYGVRPVITVSKSKLLK